MKAIYVILIAASTGIAGFLAGGGLGLAGGAAAGNIVGGVAGACLTVDTATKMQLLTPEQAEKIGVEMGKALNVKPGDGSSDEFNVEGTTEACKRLMQGIAQVKK
jgi:hypothetical protein